MVQQLILFMNIYSFKKKIIINSDDFGLNHDRDQGMIELINNQKITSISCIVNGESIEASIKKIKNFQNIGIHLNFTQGTPFLKNSSLQKNDIMFGKFQFREKLEKNEIKINDIQQETRLQMYKFIELFKFLPTHFDGHNHVHIIPSLAESIAQIMSQEFGVYKTRIPIEENLEPIKVKNMNFYQAIVEDARISKNIYQSYKIFGPEHFLGMRLNDGFFTVQEISAQLSKIEDGQIEIMCHPGLSTSQGDEFELSSSRVQEYDVLQSNEFDEMIIDLQIKKISFRDIKREYINKFKILLYSSAKFSTGNLITILRIQKILENLGYYVFIRCIEGFNIQDPVSCQREIAEIQNFAINEQINLVMGVNAYRTGDILFKAFKNQKISIPYVILISGTDANDFIDQEDKRDRIIRACENSDFIISLSKNNLQKVLNFIKFNIQDNTKVIYQSFQQNNNSNFSLKEQLNINKHSKIILLPAGIRKVKGIDFALETMYQLLNDEFANHYFFIIGQIMDENYYEYICNLNQTFQEKYKNVKERIRILPPLPHSDYLSILKQEVSLLLNTSESEGICGSIVEAFFYDIPVLVRNIISNLELTQLGEIGFIFESTEDFKVKYREIFSNDLICKYTIQKANKFANEQLNIENEQKFYGEIIQKVLNNNYQVLNFNDRQLRLFKNFKVHEVQNENIQIFNKIEINSEIKEQNLIDIGCGSGLFGFIALQILLKNKIKLKKVVFRDVQIEALNLAYQNTMMNLNIFDNQVFNFLFEQKSLFEEIDQKFDLITANLPQMPSPQQSSIDRSGREDGSYFNQIFIQNLSNFLTQKDGRAFYLRTSLGNIKKQEELINKLKLDQKLITQDIRILQIKDIDLINNNQFEYLNKCKKDEISDFLLYQDCIEFYNQLIQIQFQ